MNLIQIPFHDLRKIAAEGHRTRDAHLIEAFLSNDKIENLLVIDRPTTLLEIIIKKKAKNLDSQKVLLEKNGMKLLQLRDNYFAITYISKDILGQVLKKKKWFREKFSSNNYIDFINESIDLLGFKKHSVVSNNIFACDLFSELKTDTKIFDAWDDFAKIVNYKSIQGYIKDCYKTYAKASSFWTTNAEKNKLSFSNDYNIGEIQVITNGVDKDRFTNGKTYPMPEDMKEIVKPIYGFGGKITHLIDPEMVYKVATLNPNKSFVFVGQIISPEVLEHFKHLPNVYYLGDKHYDIYINYLANFDICLVPYVSDDKSSGANTIKVYEYLAMQKKVVGTLGNGLEKLQDYLYTATTAEQFSEFLKEEYPNKSNGFDVNSHSWSSKADKFIELLSR